jgi:hypothetical protein
MENACGIFLLAANYTLVTAASYLNTYHLFGQPIVVDVHRSPGLLVAWIMAIESRPSMIMFESAFGAPSVF